MPNEVPYKVSLVVYQQRRLLFFFRGNFFKNFLDKFFFY